MLSYLWQDEDLCQDGCFAWLESGRLHLPHTITGVTELYEQITLTRVLTSYYKTGTTQGDATCRMCGERDR